MTVLGEDKKIALGLIKSVVAFLGFFLCVIFLSKSVAKETLVGLRFAVEVILPTLFPFMVLSDFVTHLFVFEKSKKLSAFFEKAFKINGSAISALLSGMVGGFPVGAKSALELYKNGKISKCECERLMCFANIPSPAYVISAVGIGILSSYTLGLILYFVSVVSSLICGVIIGLKKNFTSFTPKNVNNCYSFVSSLKKSALSSINLIFFVAFFSAICGIIKELRVSTILTTAFITLAEVGNAVLYISDLCIFSYRFKVGLIAFSLSFSGISVLMQSLSFDGGEDMSALKCFTYKLLSGIISFIIIISLPIKI